MKRILVFVIVLVMTVAFAGSAHAVHSVPGPHRIVDDNDTVILHGNVHPMARSEFDRGEVDASLPMERMILTLRLNAVKQAELDRLLSGLHDPASPDFHHWLLPEEFGERFGPAVEDVNVITDWLKSHGFTIDEVANGRMWINFSGTAADIKRVFHTRIHSYFVNGKLRHANAQDPSIPRGLSDLTAGIVSLNDFPRKMMHNGIRPVTQSVTQSEVNPDFTNGTNHYLSPGDFATVYNLNALYSSGIDGSGQSIAIVGRTHPSSANWATFRSMMGLPVNPPQVIVNGPDPGDLGGNEDVEADLDVEWSGAVAKNAAIVFVTSKSTYASDGVDLSIQYIVDHDLAPVMSTSFGACESVLNPAENNHFNNLWQQAAAQGITSFVSTGDAGAAGCNIGSDTVGSGLGVNGLASTPYNIAVGGTQFNEGAGSYWNTTNGNGYTSAISYIPETAWNESGAVAGGSRLWSTGGGASIKYSKPEWQVSPGVPADGKRDVPDVSLSAATHDAYLIETQGGLYSVGGTSASSPSFAGIMALIVQKTGQRQGNANARFYQLGNSQYDAGGAVVFHDSTSGNNSVPGVTGYSCTTGYDLSTGLGSVDAYALVMNWVPDFTISASPAAVSVAQGAIGTSTISTTVSGNFSNDILLTVSSLPTGGTASFSPNLIMPPGNSTLTITVGAASPAGTYPIIITGNGSGTVHTATLDLAILQAFTITSSVANGAGGTVTPGAAAIISGGSATLTISPDIGHHLAILTDNGADVTTSVIDGVYTITNITVDHTVIATFVINTYDINASISTGSGSITPASASVDYGTTVIFSITPADGYTLAGLTDNGIAATAVPAGDNSYTYTITGITEGHTIEAAFSLIAVSAVPALGPWGFSAAVFGLIVLALKRRTWNL